MPTKEKVKVDTYQDGDCVIVKSQIPLSGTYGIRQPITTKLIAAEETVVRQKTKTPKRTYIIGKKGIIALDNESAKRQLDKFRNEVVSILKNYNLSDCDIENLINEAELKNAIKNGYSSEAFAQALLF